jgi:hypothetical protein
MGRADNVKPHKWKPGQSGNPGGRPKERLTLALRKYFDTNGTIDEFVDVGIQAAKGGDFRFWAYIFDRVDGKMKDDGTIGNELCDRVTEALTRELERRRGGGGAGPAAG